MLLKNVQLTTKWLTIIGAVALGFVLSGCSGGGSESASAPTGSPASSGGPGSPGRPPRGGGMTPPPGMMPPGGSYGGPAAAPMVAAGGLPASTVMPGHRPDPFAPWWKDPVVPKNPPIPHPLLAGLLPTIRPAITLSTAAQVDTAVIKRTAPKYRMVGAITGASGIFALLEGPDGQKVVKPGDKLEGYTVVSIDRDSVTIEKKTPENEIIQQIIPLSDTIPSAAPGGSGSSSGYPGGPGGGYRGPGGPYGPGRGNRSD